MLVRESQCPTKHQETSIWLSLWLLPLCPLSGLLHGNVDIFFLPYVTDRTVINVTPPQPTHGQHTVGLLIPRVARGI